MTENSQHESARLSAARSALAAANENLRAATARAQELQTDYYRALNTVTRLEPQHKKLLQALGVAKDRSYVESYASLPDKVAQITRERLAQIDSINAEIRKLLTELEPANSQRLKGEGKMNGAEGDRRLAEHARNAAHREFDIAQLSDLLAEDTDFVVDLLARMRPDQLVDIIRSAIAAPEAA